MKLSICIPAYNRREWLKRALTSITIDNRECSQEIEVIVTDDSSDPSCGMIAQEILQEWEGEGRYIANQPRLGMAENWNYGIKIARGEYILVLHDDDFLLPGSIRKILNKIIELEEQYPVLLFGVNVVNEHQQILKKQEFKTQYYLPPKQALISLLSNSSFVRFPAIVIQRRIFEDVGYFNPSWGEPTDVEMWIRLFSRYGVVCIPLTTCAYTVHSQALTMGVFNEARINLLLQLFEQVAGLNLLTPAELEDCQAKFFHQFILAGAFRHLRRNNFSEFYQVMQLFKLAEIQKMSTPIKWLLIRLCFDLLSKFYRIFHQ